MQRTKNFPFPRRCRMQVTRNYPFTQRLWRRLLALRILRAFPQLCLRSHYAASNVSGPASSHSSVPRRHAASSVPRESQPRCLTLAQLNGNRSLSLVTLSKDTENVFPRESQPRCLTLAQLNGNRSLSLVTRTTDTENILDVKETRVENWDAPHLTKRSSKKTTMRLDPLRYSCGGNAPRDPLCS